MLARSALLLTAALGALGSGLTFTPAGAATHEQIVEMCRQAARPHVVACMQAKEGSGSMPLRPVGHGRGLGRGGGRGGSPERARNLEECRETAGRSFVLACVRREEDKQAARTPAPAAPQDQTAAAPQNAAPIQPVFVAPPRTITDITAILDSEKPDAAKIAARKAEADAAPPSRASAPQLAQFYYDRGAIRGVLARNKDALADGLQALKLTKEPVLVTRIRDLIALQYRTIGDPRQAVTMYQAVVHDAEQRGRRGTMIGALNYIAETLLSMGEIDQATAYARRCEALVQDARGSPDPRWRQVYAIYGRYWEAQADAARGLVLRARGQYAEAEAAYRRAEAFRRAALSDRSRYASPPPEESFRHGTDVDVLNIADLEAKQGRLSEAEADARRALLEILQQFGKYNSATPRFIFGLAEVLIQEGRYQDAEKLTRSALDVQRTLGIGDDASISAKLLSQLGNILVLQRKMRQADAVYAALDLAIAQWPPERRAALELNGSRVAVLYASGQIEAGITAAEELVKRQTARSGPDSLATAEARGTLATGYARVGRYADAIREFGAAIPRLIAVRHEGDADDDPSLVAARSARLQRIIEAYIGLLARTDSGSGDVAVETFALADAVRGHAVQQALADANARLLTKDPALAALVRNDQDLGKEIGAELGVLNNMLALPPDQRDDQKVRAIKAEIEKLRAARKSAQQNVTRRFPTYANLIDPTPPSIEAIRAALRPGEALLSFYFGQTASFAWAVPRQGPVAFAVIPLKAIDLSAKVHRLRQALEPDVLRIEDLPPFDLAQAYELYALLLKPLESGWKGANSLIVVTNGALGELPLGLLPTAPSQVDLNAKPLFAGYRNVPWLAHTHAVTMIPSASALITLRHLPPSAPSRDKLIGFGDPYFNQQEAAEAEPPVAAAPAPHESPTQVASSSGAPITTRGIALKLRASPHTEDADRAELAMLPRLPDTRAELIAMAHALDADPAKALYLGKAANEQNVETLDLSHYRIVAFATHGLVPGDIDGLTQPALALTAPAVAGVSGDGLLTMGKILALKLDADWVVLSACNTAAGSGAGAEAASGLGSAFFYAGTRALLVTNWSVQSASARALITDLFRRQSAEPALTRAQALRQAEMGLIDGPGEVDQAGHTLFTYAHPLFWAPYSVIGDGGTN
jgi:CHAT domain-containing protein